MPRELSTYGSLFAFYDVVHFMGQPDCIARAMKMAHELYAIVDLRIGWGQSKSELDLLLDVYEPDGLDLQRGEDGRPLPHPVRGMETCLGVPRHRSTCAEFIKFKKIGKRHYRLPALVVDVC